jgi:hypothetical protein
MKHVDMRKLAAAAQEERRRQVIGLRQSGASYAAIAAQVGLSQTGVFDICKRFATKGKKGLASGKRGRKPDEQRRLTTAQEMEIKRLICRPMPDELGQDFALWSRAAPECPHSAPVWRAPGGAQHRQVSGALGL